MSRFLNDVRSGLRTLRRGRGVAILAVLAFALGIGITTAVFSVFYSVLVKPLPYPDPDELVLVYDIQPSCKTCPASFPKYTDWKNRNTVFSAIGGSFTPTVIVTGTGDPERVQAVRATASLMDVFKVPAARGRWFSEAEDQPGGPKVAVITDAYWTRRFGKDANILGRTITIDDEPYQIIGVMPPDFAHRRGEIFLPLQRTLDPATRGNHFLVTYARLKPGVTVAQAQKEMVALGRVLAAEFGNNHGIDVQPYTYAVIGSVVQPLRVLMGAVSCVLLVACANVANLLLASGLARRRELAVRSALGASRWDLTRQLTIESVILALAGGLLGVLVADVTVGAFVRLADTALPRAASIRIDGTVLAFAGILSLLTGVVCGLWPVLRIGTRSLAQSVREGDARAGTDAGGRRFGNGLVVAEIALAFSLLVGAGLLVKNLLQLEGQDTGFKADRLIAFDLAPTGARYADTAKVKSFYEQLLPRLRSIPEVSNAGVTSHLPMYQFGWNGEVTLEGGNPWKDGDAPLVENRWIGGDYFGAMGIEVIRGRAFDDRDRAGTPLVAIVSKRTADKFWPGQDPIGKRFSKGGANNPKMEVVGVVHNVLTFGLTSGTPYELYVPIAQDSFGAMTVALRTQSADPSVVMPAVRQIVASIDPLMPIARVQTMEDVVSRSVTQPRLISSLTSMFGALAGILAAVGVYGVMAYNVRRERRQFGIRLALGADPGAVRRLIVMRGVVLGGLGVVVGGVAALFLTRTLESLLTNVKPADPAVFASAGGILFAVSILACYLPARTASKTDPMVALRTE